MNFDGKAFVRRISSDYFASSHDYAFVRPLEDNSNLFLNQRKQSAGLALVVQNYTDEKLLPAIKPIYNKSLIPHTVYVHKEFKIPLSPITFIGNRSKGKHHTQSNISYHPQEIHMEAIQPTNIKYNPKTAIVYDAEYKESSVGFPGTTVNVTSKIEVIIPDSPVGYTDMSIVVQKNCFIEIKIPNTVSGVTNIPDGLMYSPGFIKGTFTKSGEFNIKVKYPDGEQIINIIVPYYQRLL